tara:strand:- start:1888 stop:2196 length:309 start_codon:yes stop_codon:yes gene_type:complete
VSLIDILSTNFTYSLVRVATPDILCKKLRAVLSADKILFLSPKISAIITPGSSESASKQFSMYLISGSIFLNTSLATVLPHKIPDCLEIITHLTFSDLSLKD